MPRTPEAAPGTHGRIRPLHVFMGLAFAAVAAITGIGAVTMFSLPSPSAPTASAPTVAAVPTPAVPVETSTSASPLASPVALAPGTPAPSSSPGQTDRPTGSATPEAADIKPSRVVASSNWAGYGLRNKQYVSVSAEWTQPEVDCSAGKEANASFWVGLDGFKSHTVEQTGTSADCRAGRTKAVYYAWYEMYPERPHQAPMAVRPGDHFSALVHATSAEKFELTLKNLTTGQTFTTSASRSGRWPTSAEWVVEPAALCNPGCVGSQLAQFADVTFTNMAAETSDGSVAFGSASSRLVQFDLRKRGAPLAHVSSLASDAPSFNISWVDVPRRN